MELIGRPGLSGRVLLAGQQRGEADRGRGQAVALRHALDGSRAGERTDAQGLYFGADGRGPHQRVASGRRDMGLEPAANGEDGPFRFGRGLWALVAGPPRPVGEALGFGLQFGREVRDTNRVSEGGKR